MVGATPRRGFWWRPQQVWLRQAMFQIHLWTGIILCLYAIVIGISGSVLVFQDELAMLTYPELMKRPSVDRARLDAPTGIAIARASEAVAQAYPAWQATTIYSPGVHGENYLVVIAKGDKYRYAFAGARGQQSLGGISLDEGWLNWMANLHFRLLAGQPGLIVNGIASACLLLVCITGAVIWWPGVQRWKRALVVDFSKRWRRINFDLHSSVGFWTLAITTIWSVSGVYFVWPEAFSAAVARISKTTNASPPEIHLKAKSPAKNPRIPVYQLIDTAMHSEPRLALQGVIYPSGDQPFAVLLTSDNVNTFHHTTWIYMDPLVGTQVGVWRVDQNKTLGEWFIWLMEPLHFGTYWGLGIKILWAFLGLLLPLLAITGLLMYWNRYLRKKLHSWRRSLSSSSLAGTPA